MGVTRGTGEKGSGLDDEQIVIDHVGDTLILRLSGQFLGGEETDRLRTLLRQSDNQLTNVILDLSGVSFVNSSFLSGLLAEHTYFRRRGVELRTASLQATVRNIMELTRLSTVIPVYDSVELATRSLE